MIFKFENLYLNNSWSSNVVIKTDNQNRIESIKVGGSEKANHDIKGWALPGFYNCHSHAFQYAFSGRTEYLDTRNSHDDFWTWRTKMYKLANSISPDEFEAIATLVFSRMLRAGYTWVTEFQYLHNDIDGNRYSNITEMSERLLRAADAVGIGITLAPTFYQYGGFNKPLREEQRRFLSKGTNEFLKLIEQARTKLTGQRQKMAIALHSLRAVGADEVKETIGIVGSKEPIHIHASEQIKEVEDCIEHLKARPVQWLADNAGVNEKWFLVHSTHANVQELEALSKAKGNVVLCPSTEGNLGDGVFHLQEYYKLGGQWCIGTDSQICVNPLEDLRWLDYSQRLKHHKRNPLCIEPGADSGEIYYQQTLTTGRRAQGLDGEHFSLGSPLDFVSYFEDSQLFASCPASRRLSTLIFSLNADAIDTVVTNGELRIKDGQWVSAAPVIRSAETSLRKFFADF